MSAQVPAPAQVIGPAAVAAPPPAAAAVTGPPAPTWTVKRFRKMIYTVGDYVLGYIDFTGSVIGAYLCISELSNPRTSSRGLFILTLVALLYIGLWLPVSLLERITTKVWPARVLTNAEWLLGITGWSLFALSLAVACGMGTHLAVRELGNPLRQNRTGVVWTVILAGVCDLTAVLIIVGNICDFGWTMFRPMRQAKRRWTTIQTAQRTRVTREEAFVQMEENLRRARENEV